MIRQTLDIKEAIGYTGLTRKQIMYFIRNSNLKYINCGQGSIVPRYRFLISELNRFLESMQTTI